MRVHHKFVSTAGLTMHVTADISQICEVMWVKYSDQLINVDRDIVSVAWKSGKVTSFCLKPDMAAEFYAFLKNFIDNEQAKSIHKELILDDAKGALIFT
jgi:hypothetical protein